MLSQGSEREGSSGSTVILAAQRCRLCGKSVVPDDLGLVECTCGWGGPDDPLETASGLARFVARVDRRLANAQARRDLRRIAALGDAASQLSPLYVLALLAVSTLIFAIFAAVIAGGAWITVTFLREQAWFGAAIVAVIVSVFVSALLATGHSSPGIEFGREDLPNLATALREVRDRTHSLLPDRIILVPDTNFFVYSRRRLRRFWRRELVLGVGMAALPALSELEVKAILAHELAHYLRAGEAVHQYTGRALGALRHVLDLTFEALEEHATGARGMRYRGRSVWRYRSTSGAFTSIAAIISWTLLLPIHLLWVGLHLLRLRASRTAEFRADAAAASAYGASTFVDALTGLRMATRTLYGSLAHTARSTRIDNVFQLLRDHYAGLPPEALVVMRTKARAGFRTLESSHPIFADRAHAVLHAPASHTHEQHGGEPASRLVVPAGAANADALEVRLTKLFLRR